MRTRIVPFAIVVLCLAGCAGESEPGRDGQVLVVATIADPIALDGALASDFESSRVVAQIVEGLTALDPGTTRVVPKLALRWSASDDGRAWRFVLRQNVRFQDGTRFDARAVCFNFDRWYGFQGTLQNRDATYYWHEIFGGFRAGSQPSLYRACRTEGPYVVSLLLSRPFGALPAALALPALGIASPDALRRYRADDGYVASDGEFRPDGTYGTRHPTGTGPFRLRSWDRFPGSQVVLEPNPDYWGRKPRFDQLVFRSISDTADRLDALRDGDVDIEDLYSPAGVEAVRGPDVRIASRLPFDVGYLGINRLHAPLNSSLVREAIGYGLDRVPVVSEYYLRGATVAREFTPPSLQGYAKDVPLRPFAPARSRDLLRRAGLSLPVAIDLWYPTLVRRPYLTEPEAIARRFAAGLDRAGFQITVRPSPWLPDYLRTVRSGGASLFLLGWVGDYADPSAFLNVLFGAPSAQFGLVDEQLRRQLERADAEPEPSRRAALYREANREVMRQLPGVPFVTTRQPVGLRRSVRGFRPSALGIDSYAEVTLSSR